MSRRTAAEERERRRRSQNQHKQTQSKSLGTRPKPKQTKTTSKPKTSTVTRNQTPAQRNQGQAHKRFVSTAPSRGTTTGQTRSAARTRGQQHKVYSEQNTYRNTVVSGSSADLTRDRSKYRQIASDRPGAKIFQNTGAAAKKGIEDRVSGWKKTALDIGEMASKDERSIKTQARRQGIKPNDEKRMSEIQDEHRKAAETAKKEREKEDRKQQKRQAEFDERTKDASGAEKALYGAAESGAGMLADLAVGAATGTGAAGSLASLGVGSYGQTRGSAKRAGATENEDRVNALLQAGKEVATERIFAGIGLAKGYAGKSAMSLSDRAAAKLTSKLTGRAANVVGAGARLAGGVAEENLEEAIGWAADPLISEASYEGRVRRRREDQVKKQLKAESDDLRSQIKDENTARSMATYLSSNDFLEANKKEYMDAGLSEKKATAMAEQMRDYLTASLTGDTDEMERIEQEMATSIAGKGLSASSWNFGELADTAAATTLLTATTGLPGAMRSSAQGAEMKARMGEDGIKALAKTAIDFEDKEMAEKAELMTKRIESGKEITDTEAYDLQQGIIRQQQKDNERVTASWNSAATKIEDQNLVSPIVQDEDGSVSIGKVTSDTVKANTKTAKSAIQAINKEHKDDTRLHLSAGEVSIGANAIAAFQSGIMTADDANALTYNNKVVRQAFEEQTGVDLSQYIVRKKNGEVDVPATNAATKDALFVLASENLVASAQAETVEWMDNTKGEVVTGITSRMGANGTVALQQALDTVDERNQSEYMLMANATDYLYQSGRNKGQTWDEVSSDYTEMFPEIDPSILESAYNAGLDDRQMAEDKLRGRAVEVGKPMSEMGEQETATGNLFVDTKKALKGTEIRLFTELAKQLGADIHLVDHIKTNAGEANGAFNPKTNTFYINVSTGAETNFGYIFMHELTHYLKVNAPEQYLALENLVREKWFDADASQMQDAIAKKVSLYKGEQSLTEEEALEEIIADAAHEFLNDRNFAKQVAEEDPTIAKALLDCIRKALRMLRNLFTVDGLTRDDTHMNALFSQLDILTDAEALWLDAYKAAVRNRGNRAIEAMHEESIRNSISETENEEFVTLSPERVDSLISEYAIPGNAESDYSKAWIATINPRDFLKLTVRDEVLDTWEVGTTNEWGQEVRELDKEDLQNTSLMPFLKIDSSESHSVIGHEGRHRMLALYRAGYTEVPVVIQDINEATKNSKQPMEDGEGTDLWSQDFGDGAINGDASIEVYDTIPINEKNRSEIERVYGSTSEDQVRFSVGEIESALKEKFDEYKKDETNLRIATEAIKDLQSARLSVSESSKGDVSRRWGRNIQVRTIAKGITSSLVNEGYIDFRGQTVNGPEDLAKLCQVLRDPRFETFRMVFTKGNKIVDFRSVSARMPGMTFIHNKASDAEHFEEMRAHMQNIGADGYYLIHNHPSGNVTASRADLLTTARTINELGGDYYKGHIILDHDKYGLIENVPAVYEKTGETLPSASEVDMYGQQTIDLIHTPEVSHPVLDETVRNSDDIAKIGSFVNASNDVSCIVYLAADGQVRGVQEIANEMLERYADPNSPNDDIRDFIREQSVEFGAMRAAVYSTTTDNDIDITSSLLNLYKEGVLLDVVRPADDISFADQGMPQDADPDLLGRSNTEVFERTIVYEAMSDYSITEEQREELNNDGIDVTEGGTAVRYSYTSWENTDKEALVNRLVDAGFERSVAEKWVSDVNTVSAMIFADMGRLNYEADEYQDALKPNAEYYYTLDLSTLCAKRRLYQGTYNAIMDRIVNRGLYPEDTVRLRKMMDDMGYEVPCGICYEESRKKNEGKFAEVWLEKYKAEGHEDSYEPTLADVTTTTGRARLRSEGHTEALESYLNYQKTRGSANPKVSFTHTDYRGDILRMTDKDVEKVKHIGGLRIQSFSDFEVVHVIDMMQAVMDMASKKLTSQAYTKVPAFADIFGGTGIKINLSLIGQVDENGELKFDAKEGIDPDEAFRIREKYPENVGTIIVGANEASILAAWADPRIDMVIPFHRSGWSKAEFEALGLGDYEDFQSYQSERYLDGSSPNGISLAKAKKEEIYSADYWDYNKTGKENAEAYLKLCAEKHYRPVFYNFLYDNGDGTWSLQEDGSTDGYWKSLIDYKMYDNDGKGAPQVEVQPNFDMDVAADVMAKYDGNADTLPVAEDVVDRFVDELAESNRYSLSDTEQRDRAYLSAVEAGNMDEAQRLVDEAAKAAGMRPMHMYHGSMNANFTVFDKSYAKVGGNSGAGFYFSTNMDDSADHYADVEGADNYFKWSELAEAIWDTGELPDGTDIGDEINSYEDAQEYAKNYLNRSPGTFDVYLNYKTPYVRDYRNSTNIFDKIMEDYDESEVDRDDYDSDEDYEDAVFEHRSDYIYEAISQAVYDANSDLEGNYEVIYGPQISEIASSIAEKAYDYESLTWDDIHDALYQLGETMVTNDNWTEDADATAEFTRAIIENFGYDAIQDKEVSTKFGQLSREMQDDTEHVIVFNPEQIKLSDPVTYAEDGSVIPLSERFDPNNNDIRYSMPTQDSEGNILTDGQMEFFKESQARNRDGKLAVVYHTTENGGFTVFDPAYSKDGKSLFFTSNRRMSESYIREGQPGDFNPYEGNTVTRQIKNVYFLPDFESDEVEQRVRSHVSNIRVTDLEGNVVAQGDDFVEVAANLLPLLEDEGYEDASVAVDLENRTDGEMGAAWEVYSEAINFGFEYTMDYATNGDSGTYTCYLNLKDPLVIEGNGSRWNFIGYGEPGKTNKFRDVRMDLVPEWTQDADGEPAIAAYEFRLEYTRKDEDGWNKGLEFITLNNPNIDDAMWLPEEELLQFLRRHEFNRDALEQLLDNENPMDGGYEYKVDGEVTFDAYSYYSTRDLCQIAYYDGHDGVIFRDIVDYGASGYGNEPGDVYVAFDSNQVKDVNNENPTEEPDIRFSITPEDDALEWLATQYELDDVPLEDEVAEEGRVRMAKSKEEFMHSVHAKWNPAWISDGKIIKIEAVQSSIRQLVMGAMANSDTNRKYKTSVVNKVLVDVKSAYYLMKDGKAMEAEKLLWDTAYDMIHNLDFIDDTTFNQYKDLRDYLRNTSFRVGEEYWQDVNYREFRKKNFGRIKLVKGDTNVDSLYHEMSQMWPEWFDENEQVAIPDQLLHIDDVLDAIQPYKYAYSSEEATDLAYDIASGLWAIIYDGEELSSVADKYKNMLDAKTKAMKERHEEALRKVKERSDELLSEEKAKRDRQIARAERWKEKFNERNADFREYKNKQKHKRYFGNIATNIDWLTTRLLNETQDKNIPEPFRRSLAHLLMQFDMQTERSKKLEAKYGVAKKTLQMRELKRRFEEIAREDDTGEFEYNGYLFYLMDALADKVDGETIDALDTEDLIVIDTMLKAIVHNFRNYTKAWKDGKQVEIAEIGDKTIEAMDARIKKYGQRKSRTGVAGMFDKLVNEGEETPIYLFDRLDPKGEGIGAMYKEMRRGEDQHIQNMAFLRERFGAMFSDYFNKKKPGSALEKWRDGSQEQTFDLKNGSITLNPAQIMSLYCLSKRPQALGHILGAGIVASPVNVGQKLRESIRGKAEQVNSVMVTYDEVQQIISTLTPEQKKLADEMQSLMNNEMAAWGNETSMKLHGIRMFREKNYFPIRSSNESLTKTADSFNTQEKIKNFGFTKPLKQNANNAIMVDDIFSVVADHCNKMSLYNAMAVPISDFMRVYNYKQRNEDGSTKTVQQAIGEAFTRKVNDYIMKFIGDVNSNTQTRSDAVNDLMNKALANYKRASIGLNMRVALQQPTAIFRSFMVIDPKWFVGVAPSKKAMDEMFEHCPIALWKSWGHYDMDMGRDIEDVMMNNDWSVGDVASMGLYGALDNVTWSIIWQAVKKEVKANNPSVEVGSDEFWKLCNDRASEVFDKTQVVDSIFHRSDVMRSKNTLTKMAVSFMAEPTLTWNVFRDSLAHARDMLKDGDIAGAGKILMKMTSVLALNAMAVSGAAAIWDAVRGKSDDDDDEKKLSELWFENFIKNLGDNANLINNIYFVSDVLDIWEGVKLGWGGTSNMALEGFETFFRGIEQFRKKANGEYQEWNEPTWYDIFMNIGGGIGYITGKPIKTGMRDAKAIVERLGVPVFADDGTIAQTEEKVDNWLEKLREKLPKLPKLPEISFGNDSESSEESEEGSESDIEAKVEEYKESLGDEYTEDQKKSLAKQYKKTLESESAEEAEESKEDDTQYRLELMSLKAEEKANEYTGDDLDEKLWDVVSDGYTKKIAKADFSYISKIREIYVKNGGDVDKFDQKILSQIPTAYKKLLSSDMSKKEIKRQELLKEYMLSHGVSDAEISDMCYHTYMASDLKAALRMNNEEYIMDELVPLVRAGLNIDDWHKLIKYMNYGAKSYDGKYSDPKYKKSTGTYVWPAQGPITSYFGYRNAPTAGASSNHPAIDIGASQGSPVVAADGGTVISAGNAGGYGNQVAIQHENGAVTYYSHLYGWNVKVGDQVSQGQQIGQVGSTGISTGPHLDFKVEINGQPVDPLKYLSR